MFCGHILPQFLEQVNAPAQTLGDGQRIGRWSDAGVGRPERTYLRARSKATSSLRILLRMAMDAAYVASTPK